MGWVWLVMVGVIIIVMDEMDEARESLLVYLQSNHTFIEEKLYNEFNIECIEGHKMAKTIREIFDFGTNPSYHYFFSRLNYNIKQYIAIQYSSKAIPSFFVLDIEKLTDILKFCITHGFDENARKENAQRKRREQNAQPKGSPKAPSKEPPKQVSKEPSKEPQKEAPIEPPAAEQSPSPPPPPKEPPKPKPKAVFIQQVKKVEPPKDQFPHVKPKVSTFLEREKIPEKKQFKIEKFTMPDLNVVMPRYLASIQKTPIKEEPEEEPMPAVEVLNEDYLNAHRKVMRERLQKLFNFYCYQQQSLGQGPTFDRMKDQGQTMNLGKFMQFCQYTKLFHSTHITKDHLIAEYKRQSEGKLEISFEIFEKIIIKLDEKYLQAMGHDPVKNPLPTYEARLMLNEPNKLGELKKQRNLVFGTRSKQGREVKEWAETERYPKKELTLHSGRFINDLSIDRKERQERQDPPKSERKQKPKMDAVIQLSDLKKLKLPKISWIVQQDEEGAPKQPHRSDKHPA